MSHGSDQSPADEPEDEDEKKSAVTESEEALTAVTLEADRFATVYLTSLLLPLVLGFTLHSLLYEKHLTWYSWTIGALTGCVYTFGFVLMCPQLYINHRLKSVSHLPWKVSPTPSSPPLPSSPLLHLCILMNAIL
jgi:hypothetical protein